MGKIKYGLKLWSNNIELFDEAVAAHADGAFDFVEVLAHPEHELDYDALGKLRVMPITIHATHSHGFHEFIMGDEQLRLWKRVTDLADFFSSTVIVLHSGQDHTVESFKQNLAFIDDPRMYIENMAGLDVNGRPMFGQKISDLEQLHSLKPICFDFEKAIKAARYQGIDYKQYITEALEKLSPTYFHISGGDSTNPTDQHLDLSASDFDFVWIKRMLEALPDVSLAFETPKRDGLANDIENMRYFRLL